MGKSQSVSISSGRLPPKKKVTAKLVTPPKPDPPSEPAVLEIEAPAAKPVSLGQFSKVTKAKDLNSFTVSELKNFCRQQGLSKMGKRTELVKRVLDRIKEVNTANPTDTVEEVFDADGNVAGEVDIDIELDESLVDI